MSLRAEQFEKLIIRELSQFFAKEVEFPLECLVTITRAKVSDDLKYATVWLSVLPEKFFPQVLKIANQKIHDFERKLFKKMPTKFTPKINFKIDTGESLADEVEKLIKEIKKED